MVDALQWPTAIMLPGGRVLRTGLFATEIYDPETGTFSVVGSLRTIHELLVQDSAIALLASGSVLFTGGWNPLGCETLPLAAAFCTYQATGRV